MGVIFDGREFAGKIEIEIRDRVSKLDRKPKLVTIYDPKDAGSRIYTEIKAKKAEELGILFEKIQNSNYTNLQIKSKIQNLNEDKNVDGIMIQTPMEGQNELMSLIDPKKDVDGMREDSPFVPATTRAVLSILDYALKTSPPTPLLNSGEGNKKGEVIVIGNKGMVGSRLQNILSCQGMDKEDFDPSTALRADVLICCTGQAGLIKPEMVSEGTICIDVGYPKGDFDPSTALRAGFFTPVPGGVGPVTVAMLFANLVHLDNGWAQ